jgi:alcohol dehydrogenase, propanol-preferring
VRALRLSKPRSIVEQPLRLIHRSVPEPGEGQLLIRTQACGVCHTDLHLVEGEIHPPHLPITPGHQVAGKIEALGQGVSGWKIGDRVGVAWLGSACGQCDYCLRGEENLCEQARFTGFHNDGGYAEYLLSDARYTLPLPDNLSAEQAAPLLCAGIIGYRSLHKSDFFPGDRLGLVGFGASAHLTIQIARHQNAEVYVFTRSEGHRELALELGAAWVGGIEDHAPQVLDSAILFAPSGSLVPVMLEKLRPGGTLAINAIHMSPIPEMPYALIYGERTLRSVANATFQDGLDFLEMADEVHLKAQITTYPLDQANQALLELSTSAINGAGVLVP